MSKYFFSYIDDIPKDIHNSLFSVQHILAIGMVIFSWAILTLVFKDKSLEKKWRFISLISLFLPLLEIVQMIWYKSIGQFSFGYTLPLHLCSLMCVILPTMVFTKSELLMEYSYAIGLSSALMAIITPDIYSYPSFSFIYLQSMLVHGIICFIPIFLIFAMGFRPKIRNLPKVIGMLIGLSILITPVNYFTNGNYFFLRFPALGSPMEIFEDFVGNPWYLVLTLLLGCILWVALYLPFVIIEKREKYKVWKQIELEKSDLEQNQPVLHN